MTLGLINGWWFTSAWEQGPVYAVAWLVWVVVSIVLHELAHGVAAIRCGDRTPIETGHMTWNPIVHMGRESIIMLAVVGVAWGAMPVTPARLRGRYAEAKVAFAGPWTNLCLAAITVVLDALWLTFAGQRVADHILENVHVFLAIGGMLNIVLFALNLMPLPPLDGSRILAAFVPAYREWTHTPQGPMVGLLLFIPIFLFGGRYLYPAAMEVFDTALSAALGLIS